MEGRVVAVTEGQVIVDLGVGFPAYLHRWTTLRHPPEAPPALGSRISAKVSYLGLDREIVLAAADRP